MGGKLRLFFAAWPEEGAARKLERWARDAERVAGGRVTKAATIHLTLAFLGDVASDRLHAAVQAAKRVSAAVHSFCLDTARYWPHNRIVWVGPSDMPAALSELAAALKRELEAEGFKLEARPFAAHITLIRKAHARRDLPPLPPIDWKVHEFVLVRSRLSSEGSSYEVVERFALGARPRE